MGFERRRNMLTRMQTGRFKEGYDHCDAVLCIDQGHL